MKEFKGPAKQRGFIQGLGSLMGLLGGGSGPKPLFGGGSGSLLSGLGGLFGGLSNVAEVNQTRGDINDFTSFQGQNADFGFGTASAGAGGQNSFAFNPQQQLLQQLLQGGSAGQLGGGLFNDQNFQNAFQNNDIQGALGQSNQALGQQAGNTAFGGLGGLFNQSQGLSSLFAGQAAGGPQDVSGGLMQQLLGGGFANQQAAGDQSALFNQSLASQRAAAQPNQDRLFNRLQDRQFAQGRLGSSGGAGETQAFFDSLGQQDLGFQNNAFGQAQARSNFLGGLGSQQIGQGQGFLGQSLGQFNQTADFANQFGQSAAGFEGQGFQQMLQSLMQNQSAGNQRLQNAMGLFGQGADVFNQSFGQGLQGLGIQQGFNQQGLDSILGLRNAEANRISATGQGSRALADVQGSSGGLFGGLLGGLFG